MHRFLLLCAFGTIVGGAPLACSDDDDSGDDVPMETFDDAAHGRNDGGSDDGGPDDGGCTYGATCGPPGAICHPPGDCWPCSSGCWTTERPECYCRENGTWSCGYPDCFGTWGSCGPFFCDGSCITHCGDDGGTTDADETD